MRDNFCIYQKIMHVQSGQELPSPYLNYGTLFETLELDGPGIILEYRDTEEYIRSEMKIKEYDEIVVSYGDPWNDGSVNLSETFVVLTCKPSGKGLVKLNCLAKPVFKMKQLAEKAVIYQNRSVSEILSQNSFGASVSCSKFAIVETFQRLSGERTSVMLRQIADAYGAHIWYDRGTLYMKSFDEMLGTPVHATYHWGTFNESNHIFKYNVPSTQVRAQETSARTFAGWDEVMGRVTLPLDLPFLKLAKSKPVSMSSSTNATILGNATVAKKTAIDFLAIGRMSVVPGCKLNLAWHMPGQGSPVDEGLPREVIVESVSHWYSTQKYYMRVKGAVKLEPV